METKKDLISSEGLLSFSKADIAQRVKDAVQSVNDGKVDKIEAYLFAKKGESLFKDLSKRLKEIAEGVGVGQGGLVKYNADITESMQGVSYDYSECGDREYDALVVKLAEVTADIEDRAKFLQAIKKPLELVDVDSGETYTVNPPIKKGKLGLTVKIK